MKTDRRAELKTNDLSVQIQRGSEFLKEHGNTVLLCVAAAVLLIGAVMWRNHNARGSQELGWNLYYTASAATLGDASDPEWIQTQISAYKSINDEFDNPELQNASHAALAQFCFRQLERVESPEIRNELLSTAEKSSQVLLTRSRNNPPRRAAALNWLATVEKNRFAVDNDPAHKEQARKYLEQVRDDPEFLGTPFQKDALAQLNQFDALWHTVVLADPPPAEDPGPPAIIEPMPAPPAADQPVAIPDDGTTGDDASDESVDDASTASPDTDMDGADASSPD